MGANVSSDVCNNKLEELARIKFNTRVNAYSYVKHGPYNIYYNLCCAQYELDLVPKYCQKGENYVERE